MLGKKKLKISYGGSENILKFKDDQLYEAQLQTGNKRGLMRIKTIPEYRQPTEQPTEE